VLWPGFINHGDIIAHPTKLAHAGTYGVISNTEPKVLMLSPVVVP
jgi:hypothetical protein